MKALVHPGQLGLADPWQFWLVWKPFNQIITPVQQLLKLDCTDGLLLDLGEYRRDFSPIP